MTTEKTAYDLPQTEAAERAPTVTTAKPKKSQWRWLCRGVELLFIIVLIPLLFLMTGYGQRTALELADKWLEPLSIGKVSGSLQEGLTLQNTQFQTAGVEVNVAQADLHLGVGCLLKLQACVENIALKDPKIVIDSSKLPASQPQTDYQPLGDISLPLAVKLKQLSVDNLQLSVDGMDINLGHFHSGVEGKGKNLTLLPTKVEQLHLLLAETTEQGDKQAVEKQQNSAKAKEMSQPVDWVAIKEKLSKPLLSKLEPITLPMHFSIPDFQAHDIQVAQKVANAEPNAIVNVSNVELEAKSDDQTVELNRLVVQSDKGDISGNGKLTLGGNYPLDWQISAKSPELKELKIPASSADLTLSGELFGTTSLKLNTTGAAKAELQGNVQLAEPKTPFNLTLKSDGLSYPFMPEKGQDPLKLQNVDIALGGDLLNYQLNASAKSSGMGLPESSLQIKGAGELTAFNLENLTLNALQGKTQLAGKVDWSNGIEWNSQVQLDGVNTKSLLPDWAATLSGKLASTGYAGRGTAGADWAVAVSEMDLHGNLMQKALSLKGALNADNKTLLNVPNASLIYGENKIDLKGVLGDKSDFQAEIKAPNLAGLVPNLKASLNGVVKLSGKVAEPHLDLDLTANNLSYDALKLQHLSAKGKVTTEKEIVGDVKLDLRQFAYGEVKVENADLTLSGSEKNHQLKLRSKGDPVGANLQISGKFDRLQQVWAGQLSNVAIQSPMGEWKNSQPISVSYNNKQIMAEISAHCWNNPKLNICFPTAFKAGQEGKVPFEIKRFDLAAVQEYLDKNSQLSGVVNAKGDAAWFKNKAPEVNLELNSDGVKFIQQVEHKSFPLSLAPVKIKANLANNDLKLNSDIRLENNGKITSDLLMKEITKTRALSGHLNIDGISLKLVEPLLNKGETVNGEINARLTFGGTAAAPLLNGHLTLANLSAKSNAMPFDTTGGGLALHFAGTSSTLKGNVQTKESELILEGDANWKRLDAWHTRIHAKANRFRVDVPNMAKVDISPDIEVKATPKALILGGNIDIPWARIEVEELPESAVSVSSDEVIMDGSAKRSAKAALAQLPKTTNSGMAIQADVKINIGNDVKLNAYGLKTELNGTIVARQGSKGLGLYGQVNLKNGSFASFGQDLIIRKGVISFAGLPSQPTLNIEAIRNPEAIEDTNVTAGVKVTGLADAPEVSVFSEPSMSQDQALSYILTGRGLESSGDAGSSNSIAAALIGMSLSKSSKLVGGVGSAFGINDLNVTTAGIGDNTKVVVSGSLTPKFKVKYGVGIFAPLTELTLRYRLAPSLYLQWVSSINQAVDLIYNFEFD